MNEDQSYLNLPRTDLGLVLALVGELSVQDVFCDIVCSKRFYREMDEAFSLSLYLHSHQGSSLSLPNFITHSLCFLTAY